ncbi:MAG TPA: transposase [Candidatus Angelobacter sp.]|nr:transposase [Candidatus Angelobacter sp.]
MKPAREHATNNRQTYFVTSETAGRHMFFSNERWAKLFLEVLLHYRPNGYLLHEFVIMPEHFHATITPKASLEKAVQFIKGGFSFRARRELGYKGEIWQRGFSDHRIRDSRDCKIHKDYIHQNPVKRRLVFEARDYPYSSASGSFELDPVPQWLKPFFLGATDGTAKAVPFQTSDADSTAKTVHPQSTDLGSAVDTKPLRTWRKTS